MTQVFKAEFKRQIWRFSSHLYEIIKFMMVKRFKLEKLAFFFLSKPKKLRLKAENNQKRKASYMNIIDHHWGERVGGWDINRLGETCLSALASITKKYELEQAITMVTQITMTRLREVRSGRDSARQVITRDWQDLDRLSDESAQSLLAKERPSTEELRSSLIITVVIIDLMLC